MMTLRPARARGHADHGWLRTWHAFSFADYFDPRHMGWGNLRVLNEDIVAPGTGFGMHGHRDMEIVTWVLRGALTHRDSLGHAATIRPGEVQRMSAGRGVRHSEVNEGAEPVHLLQIWVLPRQHDLEPAYEQRAVDAALLDGRLLPVVAPAEGGTPAAVAGWSPLRWQADATLRVGRLDGAQRLVHALAPARLGYLHVARGRLRVNGTPLEAGDAVLLRDEAAVELTDGQQAEVLLFDLAP